MIKKSKIFSSQLFHLSSLNSLSILVRVAGGLVASKMIALFIGPAGMALTGNFRNFLTSLDSFSMVGIQNGIIKYTAEHEKDTEQLNKALATSFFVIIASILLCTLALVIPACYWSTKVFNGNVNYAWVFYTLGAVLPFYTGSILFITVLNGLGRYRQVIKNTIWANIIGVLVSALLIWNFGVRGAFIGLIATPVILFGLSFYPLYRAVGFTFLKRSNFDKAVLKNMGSYSLMSLITAILAPVVFISLRNTIITGFGPAAAGYWEAINRISGFYTMFAATLITVYFLPKLSQTDNLADKKVIIRSYYKVVVPVFAIGLIVIYFLKTFIIRLLFSPEFLPMENLFIWQLTGDFFKVCSLILAQEFFARKLTKAFIVAEIASFTILYVSGTLLISRLGAEGAVMAHTITYFCLLTGLGIFFRKVL